MPGSFFPHQRDSFVAWLRNFTARIIGNPTLYHVPQPIVDELEDTNNLFEAAYARSNDKTTRTEGAVAATRDARDAVIAQVREVSRLVQSLDSTTDEMRRDLGITVPKRGRTPVPVPAASPGVQVTGVVGREVSLLLFQGEPANRRRPAGVKGATIFSYIGETPPGDLKDWKFELSTPKRLVSVVFDESVQPGTKVWVTAFWFNTTSQSGPACLPVEAQVGYGSLPRAA